MDRARPAFVTMHAPDADITQLLQAWRDGDKSALNVAMPHLYDLLRQMAAKRLSGERAGMTLDPTDLVHEAMARLFGSQKRFDNRLHFLAVGALYMRSILTDRARDILAGRRPGMEPTITLSAAQRVPGDADSMDLAVLDQALTQLEVEDARAAQVLELRSFGGMEREDIAAVLGVSLSSVNRDLRFARAWINQALA